MNIIISLNGNKGKPEKKQEEEETNDSIPF